jgi:hypothetical protein
MDPGAATNNLVFLSAADGSRSGPSAKSKDPYPPPKRLWIFLSALQVSAHNPAPIPLPKPAQPWKSGPSGPRLIPVKSRGLRPLLNPLNYGLFIHVYLR